MATDIIAAIATPPGRGGIGIVRVSGPALTTFYTELTGRAPRARRADIARFLADDGATLDEGIALFFAGPQSFTGEDVIELQGHGGPVVLQLLLQRCLALGARPAAPGEFTQRAFLNGKLDLAQAEGVADLIDAATAAAARSAMRSLSGEFSATVDALVTALTELRALTEATLDFPDEEVDFLQAAGAHARLDSVRSRLDQVLVSARRGALLRDGIKVVIAGAPNVGKSSIINKLSGHDVAIVTAVPGTTRDAIRQDIQLAGVPLHLVDTAGLRATDDLVEQLGIARTRHELAQADIVVEVVDATHPTPGAEYLGESPAARITVRNKIDLTGEAPVSRRSGAHWTVALSAMTGVGMDLLGQAILAAAGWEGAEEGLFLARERHLQALQAAASHLERATERTGALELFAEELRLAQEELGSITGRVTPDELLGQIFSRFCIGK
ncbi:MAG: tRNA uridine-5-carboxymethylaminomethyl(34) synthesis GTPase MnmE [Burkholderiales bacterium]